MKVGSNTASFVWWDTFLHNFNEHVPERTFYRAILSCLVTYSLSKRAAAAIFNSELFSFKGTIWGGLFAVGSLMFFAISISYHGFMDMRDAQRELTSESPNRKLHDESPRRRHPS